MAPTCSAHANMYEEPRPPRRGSHRLTLVSCTPPRLNDWMNTRTGYGLASLPRYDVQAASIPVRERVEDNHPEVDESWTHGRLLPARRTKLQNTMTGRQRLTNTERPIPSTACTDKAFYSFRSLVPSEPLPSFAARTSTVGSSAPSSLELIRQFHDGRVPNRDALEQSILESYARSAPQSAACQSTQKRCMYPGCSKISVSRGLCRGHGGGRRCHVPGCTKSAQSRSNFCWAHGGGQRCDVDQCMRSRKSKHFCVSHMHLEPSHDGGSGSTSPTNSTTMDHRTTACRAASGASGKKSNRSRATSPPVRALPSLGQALSSASRSAPNLPARSAKPFVSV